MTATQRLSPRQTEILRLVSRGKTNKEIASELGISSGTVRTHLRIVFARMRVVSRAHAVYCWSNR